MKENITDQPLETSCKVEGSSAEVSIKKIELDEINESHANAAVMSRIRAAFMQTCGMPNGDFVDTEAMSKPKALVACAMTWKNMGMKMPVSEALSTSPMSSVIKATLDDGEYKNLKKYSESLAKDEPLIKAIKGIFIQGRETEATSNWGKVESAEREEYAEAKTKKEWEKIDKKELDRDSKKEKEEHEKDAVEDDDSKIKKLKKGKPSVKKDVEIHDLKKDQELDREDKTKYSKADDWEDTDKDELKKDDKKEKKEHEKDAVKDDKKQIKDLKKDEKEDKKDEKKDSKASVKDYSQYWDYAAERFDGKKRSELKDSVFLDSKTRTFPVVSCKNVKAAVSTWGLYKGDMSFETFKRKLKARAKKIGCESSLPKDWKED